MLIQTDDRVTSYAESVVAGTEPAGDRVCSVRPLIDRVHRPGATRPAAAGVSLQPVPAVKHPAQPD